MYDISKMFIKTNMFLWGTLKIVQFFSDPTVERYVLTLTIRDSPDCFVNVSCWGGEQHVTCLASQFHIGHVGEMSSYTSVTYCSIFFNFQKLSHNIN